jgi:nickel/cobalt exporter
MPDIAQIIVSGAANPWLYLPVAVLLGALHALEPGHSKSIMAAFLIAVRGTPGQALLLGVSAAIGHTLVVWLLVVVALWFGNTQIERQAYPWLVLLSGVLILAIALRLGWQIYRGRRLVTLPVGVAAGGAAAHAHHQRDHPHDHPHDHADGHLHGDHRHHVHDHAGEVGHCGHDHASPAEIEARFAGRKVKSWEVIWFGFTGGLLPCPSAIAVLLVALQLNAYALGVAMVAAFSLGLAATLVAVGLVAVWSVRRFSGTSGFERWSRHLPLVSIGLVLLLGTAVTLHGVVLLRG